jgi:ATP-binding protein involved in chromosome partitioning
VERAAPAASPADDERRVRERLMRIRHRIVVLSGKGGVGKSTVAVNLAVALAAQGFAVGLLDVDIHGPSVPIMLGLEDARPASHDGALVPVEFVANLKVMSIGFLLSSREDPVIWRGPLKYSIIKQFLGDVEWGDLDYLIVDAPPGTGDEPLSVIQLLGDLDGAVLVTTPQEVALSDVRKCVRFCAALQCRVLGLIENMSGLVCPHCGETISVFRQGGGEALAREAGVPFLGAVPLDPELVQAGDLGKPYMAAFATSPTAEAFRRAIGPLMALDGQALRRG